MSGQASRTIHNSRRWRRLRRAVLACEPLCRCCEAAGRANAAAEVDHVVPIGRGGEEWDRANLQPLCRACHEAKSARENAAALKRVGLDGVPLEAGPGGGQGPGGASVDRVGPLIFLSRRFLG